ncbi:unnamed protein product [marine sediment metagenome]|uniref:Uncharacterized protein n=1 Tax=marine sediment metagenome TaxID=412755 RepID=X1NW54_9ZZZZ
MTIDEAIKKNEDTVYQAHTNLDVGQNRAILLGIEALRRIEATRLVRKTGTVVLLPGETKD